MKVLKKSYRDFQSLLLASQDEIPGLPVAVSKKSADKFDTEKI